MSFGPSCYIEIDNKIINLLKAAGGVVPKNLQHPRISCRKCEYYRSEVLTVPLPYFKRRFLFFSYDDTYDEIGFELLICSFVLSSNLFSSCINPSFRINGIYDDKDRLGTLYSYFDPVVKYFRILLGSDSSWIFRMVPK